MGKSAGNGLETTARGEGMWLPEEDMHKNVPAERNMCCSPQRDSAHPTTSFSQDFHSPFDVNFNPLGQFVSSSHYSNSAKPVIAEHLRLGTAHLILVVYSRLESGTSPF